MKTSAPIALIVRTILFQGATLVCGSAITIVIAQYSGQRAVGSFNEAKVLNDTLVSLFTFGLPHGVAFHIRKFGFGARQLMRCSFYYGISLVGLCLPLYLVGIEFVKASTLLELPSAGFLIGGSVLFTIYGIQRGVAMAIAAADKFSLISGFPYYYLTMLAYPILVFAQLDTGKLFFWAGLASVVSTMALLSNAPRDEVNNPLRLETLTMFSANIGVQSVLLILPASISLVLFRYAGGTIESWGVFTIATIVLLIPTSLIALIAPLLFVYWTSNLKSADLKMIYKRVAGISLLGQAFSMLLLPFSAKLIEALWGSNFLSATDAVTPLICGLGAFLFTRLAAPAAQSQSFHTPLLVAGIARILTLILIFGALAQTKLVLIQSMGVAWTTAELVAALVIWFWPRKTLELEQHSNLTSS